MENNEENKIQDAQVSSDVVIENVHEGKNADTMPVDSDSAEENPSTSSGQVKKEPSFRSHLAMIFLLGFLIGIAVKTEALKKITIGYNDYLMKIKSQSYNINDIQTKLQQQTQAAAQTQAGAISSGGASDSTVTPDQGEANDSSNATDLGNVPTPDGGQANQGGANNQLQN